MVKMKLGCMSTVWWNQHIAKERVNFYNMQHIRQNASYHSLLEMKIERKKVKSTQTKTEGQIIHIRCLFLICFWSFRKEKSYIIVNSILYPQIFVLQVGVFRETASLPWARDKICIYPTWPYLCVWYTGFV